MSDQGNFIVALITGGLGAAIGSIGTALVQSFSKKGEARAVAADRVTNAAGNLADRLDKLNNDLEEENRHMRQALVAIAEAIEELLPMAPDEDTRKKIRDAIRIARIAFR